MFERNDGDPGVGRKVGIVLLEGAHEIGSAAKAVALCILIGQVSGLAMADSGQVGDHLLPATLKNEGTQWGRKAFRCGSSWFSARLEDFTIVKTVLGRARQLQHDIRAEAREEGFRLR